jgi:hypothetical protein
MNADANCPHWGAEKFGESVHAWVFMTTPKAPAQAKVESLAAVVFTLTPYISGSSVTNLKAFSM